MSLVAFDQLYERRKRVSEPFPDEGSRQRELPPRRAVEREKAGGRGWMLMAQFISWNEARGGRLEVQMSYTVFSTERSPPKVVVAYWLL